MTFERKSDDVHAYGMHGQMPYNYGQAGPPGLQFNGPVQNSGYEKEQKLKKSINGLAFWLVIFSLVSGFIGAYFYDRWKSIKKQMTSRPFSRPPEVTRTEIAVVNDSDDQVDERFEPYEQHKEFRDKSMKYMNGSKTPFRGDEQTGQ